MTDHEPAADGDRGAPVRLPAVGSKPVDAPARYALELSPSRQARPLPFGRTAAGPRRLSDGVAERFIRTLKENLLWVRSFDTIEELRLALLEFKRTYNEQWMLEKYHYQSPAQVRRDFVGLDAAA